MSIYKYASINEQSNANSNISLSETFLNEYTVVNENSICISNCESFVTDDLVRECFGDPSLINQAAILEGAKFDFLLSNFLKEGKDYKGLKKELRDIIKYNNMDDSDLETNKKGALHCCKRIAQILTDITGAIDAGATVSLFAIGAITVNPALFVIAILNGMTSFIINRLLRLLWDTVEFNAVKEDAKSIVEDLRTMAKNTEDKNSKDKFNKEADRLEEAIRKYSKKNADSKKK